ncbi:MAG: hydantoinase/oxoprolinase family protein, partial [Acidimicrobiales bacterium]
HETVLGIADPASPVEVVGWGARVRCPLRRADGLLAARAEATTPARPERDTYADEVGMVPTAVLALGALSDGEVVEGPVIVESVFTTVVLPKGSAAHRADSGSLVVEVG